MIACDTKKCECDYNGQKYAIGRTGIPHLDGCQVRTHPWPHKHCAVLFLVCLSACLIWPNTRHMSLFLVVVLIKHNCFRPANATPKSKFTYSLLFQTCQCNTNADIICDNKVCTCSYQGRSVQIGSTFDKGDGCNTCQCMQNGQVRFSRCKVRWVQHLSMHAKWPGTF